MYSQLCAIVIKLIDNILEHGYEHISIVINNSMLHLSHISISNCSADSSIIRESLLVFFAGSFVMTGVFPFSNSDGIVSGLRGGVRDIGEFRKFIKNARSYTMRVPPGVVE